MGVYLNSRGMVQVEFVADVTESHPLRFLTKVSAFSGQGRPDILDSKAIREELNEIFRDSVRLNP